MKTSNFCTVPLLLTGLLVLGGCAALNDATMRAFASPAPALAVLGDRVLSGEALLYTDRSATLELRSSHGEPPLSCMGRMQYTSSTGGTLSLSCSDGSRVQLPYLAITEASGHGSNTAGQLVISMTYGLEPEAARAWLIAPPGKRLSASGGSLRIE